MSGLSSLASATDLSDAYCFAADFIMYIVKCVTRKNWMHRPAKDYEKSVDYERRMRWFYKRTFGRK
jgi:hypothetical protein